MQTHVCDAVFFPHALSFISFSYNTPKMFTLRDPSAFCPTVGNLKKKGDDAQGTFCLALGKLHGRHAVEHLSVSAARPVISPIKVFLSQLRQTDGVKAGRRTGTRGLYQSVVLELDCTLHEAHEPVYLACF